MGDEVKWTNKSEKDEAAREAILYLLNAKKADLFTSYEHTALGYGTVYLARTVDVPVPDEDGDIQHELCWNLKVKDDGTFHIQQWGKERPRRHDDRSVECDTLHEAFQWIQRRARTFGKRRDEARVAETARAERKAKRAAVSTERKAAWKKQVVEYLPAAYCYKLLPYHHEKASLAGEASGYGDRIMVTAENLDPYIPDNSEPNAVQAVVNLQWTGDPTVALVLAGELQTLASKMNLSFPKSERTAVPYTEAFTKEED